MCKTSDDEVEEKGEAILFEKSLYWCYGTKAYMSKTYIMAGGSINWWNYVVDFDVDTGEQTKVYIESRTGKIEQIDGYLFVNEDGNRLALNLDQDIVESEGWLLIDIVDETVNPTI